MPLLPPVDGAISNLYTLAKRMNKIMKKYFYSSLVAGSLAGLLAGCSGDQSAAPADETTAGSSGKTEYLVTVTRPGSTINIVNMDNYTLEKQCDNGLAPGLGTLVMSPDNKVAYILANHASDVYGISIDSCEMVFSTRQSEGNVRAKTMAGMAVSPDGKKIYTHQNRVRLMNDHYELLEPQVAVFDTSAGLNVEASQTFPAPRQITTMSALDSGDIILGGQDIYQMDTATGEYSVILKSLNHEDPAYAPRDVLTFWPMDRINNEFIRLYSTARWLGEPGDLNNAEWLWGYEWVNLSTGEAGSEIFGPLEVVLFSGARRPNHPEKMYATLNHLKEYDITNGTETASIDLDHSYYTLNFSRDGEKIYLLGAADDIAVFDANTLEKIVAIQLPGDGAVSNNVVFRK